VRPEKTGKARPVLVGAAVLAAALAVELVDELADGAKSAVLPYPVLQAELYGSLPDDTWALAGLAVAPPTAAPGAVAIRRPE